MGAREEAKEYRRQQILDAVVDILEREGMPGLSTGAIAESAGLSVATLYNLIGGLDAILGALIRRELNAIRRHFATAERGCEAPAVFDAYVEASAAYLRDYGPSQKAVVRALFQQSVERVDDGFIELTEESGRQILIRALNDCQRSGHVRPGVDTALIGTHLVSIQAMLMQVWASGALDDERFRLNLAHHFSLLLSAVAQPAWRRELEVRSQDLQRQIGLLGSSRPGG